MTPSWVAASSVSAYATHSGAVGLYYTGRSSLALGLEASMFVEPFIADRDLTTYQGIFGMQYFW